MVFEHLERDIEQIPDDAGLRLAYGECLIHLHKYTDALRQFRAAESICPDQTTRISPWIDRCRSLLFLERISPERIDQVLSPDVRGSPDKLASTLFAVGKRFQKAGEIEEAREIFHENNYSSRSIPPEFGNP